MLLIIAVKKNNTKAELKIASFFCTMAVSVFDLMVSPFSNRSLEEKIKIVSQGKHLPDLKQHVCINSEKIRVRQLFEQEMWLTASGVSGSIVCWICLLFPLIELKKSCIIAHVSDPNLHDGILQHKRSVLHINGLYQYYVFVKENNISDNHIEKKSLQKITDEQNFAIFKRIIDVTCLLVANEYLPVKATRKNAFDVENCVQALTVLKRYDTSGVTEKTINIIRRCPQVITKIMEAIEDVMKITIKKEIDLCSCVSLILTEYSKNSKFSLIARYINNGEICVRFIDIIDVKDLDPFKTHIFEIITECKLSKKLVSFSCDGGVLTIDHMSDLVTSLQELYPPCVFVPCYFHDIDFVLEQRLSSLEGCAMFFSIINSMKTFFENNPRLCEILESFSEKKIPNLSNLKLSNAQFLRMLKLYRRQFKDFFSHITDKHINNITNNELVKAMGFVCILEEYDIVFRIEAFHALFNHIAILNDTLNSGCTEKVFDVTILENVETALKKEKINGFEKLWITVVNELIEDCNRESLEFHLAGKNETDALLEFYLKAIDYILAEIQIRFKCVHKMEFLSVLNNEAHGKLLVSEYQVKQIKEMHANFIDKRQVINEMAVLSECSGTFGGKSVYEFMDIIKKMDLKDTFINVYKLGEIILTLPCKRNFYSEKPSKFDESYAWSLESNKPELKSLTFLSIEKDFLHHLKSQPEFYENVILKLREKKCQIPFDEV